MHSVSALLLYSFAAFIAYILFGGPRIRRHGKSLRRPPGTLPLVGNGILFLQARQRLFAWFVKCERQFGFETFEISVPSLPPGVVINDPKNLEYVFKNEGIFTKGDFFRRRSWDLFGNGIINADGELWRVQRKAGLHFLSNANIKVLTDVALPPYLNALMQNLDESNGAGIDLEAVFHELTTQLMGRMAYNMEMHNTDPFAVSFEYASGITGERFQNPLWQVSEVFFGAKFRDAVTKVKSFGSTIVANAVQTRQSKIINRVSSSATENGNGIEAVSGSLINSLLDSMDDRQMVADAALNYLSAGRDTTAQALTWTFYLLMRHPEVVTQIRQEIDPFSVSSNAESMPNGSLPPALLQLSDLPYTISVLYETLRLYPPVPFELKQCSSATTLPDGTYLPASAVLVWCTWAMNRSHLIWGSDATEFKPERWLENRKFVARSTAEYPVFNGGPRTCLGKKMAEGVAVRVIAELVQRFDFEEIVEQERGGTVKERVSRNSLTLPMKGGLPCRVRRRRVE